MKRSALFAKIGKYTALTVIVAVGYLSIVGKGGDTSSGGGGGGGVGVAGTYVGLANGSISAPGIPTTPVSGSVTFVIDAAGNVTYDPGQPYSTTVPLSGNSFTVSAPLNVIDPRCTGTMDLHGTVSGGMITGTIGSTGAGCLGVSVTASGSFSASKIAKSPSRSQHSFMNSVGDTLGSVR